MRDYEELQGQTTIFDFLPGNPVYNQKYFNVGDKVRIRYYEDEIDWVNVCHPQLMGVGEIIGKKLDFYLVRIADIEMYVPGEKLKLY